MRAKMRLDKVVVHFDVKHRITHEDLHFSAVSKNDGPYPEDGSDENNTYAKWTPSASLSMSVTNPELFGKHVEGQEFYVDFTLVE